MSRTLIIGDIHGCFDELQALLDQVGLGEDDQIIALGDLVNRGPASARTLDFFWHPELPALRSIRGNHEQKHVRAFDQQASPTLSMLLTRWEIGDRYAQAVEYMRGLPVYLDLPDALLVHAYFEPGVPLEAQEARVLLGTMGATRYLIEAYPKPWHTYYDGEKPIIVGHKDLSGVQKPFVYRDRVYGLDTGCVYGGSLTGLLLPEFRLYSVPARKPYWQETLLNHLNPE